MLNLGSETSPSSQILSIPRNFRKYRWGTETGAFLWPSCYCFCKKLSTYNISSYYFKHKSIKSQSSLYHLKKVSDGQSDIHITIKYVFLFLQIIIPSLKKLLWDLEILFKWTWVLFCNLILWLAKPGSKMPWILLFEIEYLLEFVSTNSPFLSRPSDTKIQTAIICCLPQQQSQIFENVLHWTTFFDMQILRSCH